MILSGSTMLVVDRVGGAGAPAPPLIHVKTRVGGSTDPSRVVGSVDAVLAAPPGRTPRRSKA
jgi:hypothetical protein